MIDFKIVRDQPLLAAPVINPLAINYYLLVGNVTDGIMMAWLLAC